MLADYHLVRRRRLKLKDLYVGNGTSIYWFDHGFNWRALAAFIAGAWPLVRTSWLFMALPPDLMRRR